MTSVRRCVISELMTRPVKPRDARFNTIVTLTIMWTVTIAPALPPT
jgi:hypothetical protein